LEKKKKLYDTGIRTAVLEIIRSIEPVPGKEWVNKSEIISEMKRYYSDMNNLEQKVGQALYHLSRSSKFRRKEIEKVYVNGVAKGWSIVKDEIEKIYKEK
jgi:hypothetical protein